MSTAQAWIAYTAVRIVSFAAPCAAIVIALPGWQWRWLVGIAVGAIMSALVSYIFLREQRRAMAAGIAERRGRADQRGADDIAEDEALDRAASPAPGTAAQTGARTSAATARPSREDEVDADGKVNADRREGGAAPSRRAERQADDDDHPEDATPDAAEVEPLPEAAPADAAEVSSLEQPPEDDPEEPGLRPASERRSGSSGTRAG